MRLATPTTRRTAIRVRVAIAILALVLGPSAVLVSPARAAEPSVVVRDQKGDVRITPYGGEPITLAQRRSIDIRRIAVIPRPADHSVRFRVRIAKALRSLEFDQMVFVQLESVDDDADWILATVGWSPQRRRQLSYATVYLEGNDETKCVAKRLRTRYRIDTLIADIPNRCIPSGRVRVTFGTGTGVYRGSDFLFSADGLKVKGPRILR